MNNVDKNSVISTSIIAEDTINTWSQIVIIEWEQIITYSINDYFQTNFVVVRATRELRVIRAIRETREHESNNPDAFESGNTKPGDPSNESPGGMQIVHRAMISGYAEFFIQLFPEC